MESENKITYLVLLRQIGGDYSNKLQIDINNKTTITDIKTMIIDKVFPKVQFWQIQLYRDIEKKQEFINEDLAKSQISNCMELFFEVLDSKNYDQTEESILPVLCSHKDISRKSSHKMTSNEDNEDPAYILSPGTDAEQFSDEDEKDSSNRSTSSSGLNPSNIYEAQVREYFEGKLKADIGDPNYIIIDYNKRKISFGSLKTDADKYFHKNSIKKKKRPDELQFDSGFIIRKNALEMIANNDNVKSISQFQAGDLTKGKELLIGKNELVIIEATSAEMKGFAKAKFQQIDKQLFTLLKVENVINEIKNLDIEKFLYLFITDHDIQKLSDITISWMNFCQSIVTFI